MKKLLKIIVCMLGLLFVVICCESPVESDSSDTCYYYDKYGIHSYPCSRSNYGGGGYNGGGTNNSGPVRILIHLPDTAKGCAYGIFFITDTMTNECDYIVRGVCGEKVSFAVYTYNVPKSASYMAVFVSKTQQPPINFEPVAGDYLGWYGGVGTYAGVNSAYQYPNIYSVFLSEVQ